MAGSARGRDLSGEFGGMDGARVPSDLAAGMSGIAVVESGRPTSHQESEEFYDVHVGKPMGCGEF